MTARTPVGGAPRFADLQPECHHAQVSVSEPPFARMLPALRGVRLAIERVETKFTYDDHNPIDHPGAGDRPPR